MRREALRMRVRVWDLPTRLFHWLLAATVAGAWFTGDTGGNWLIWHGRIGLFIIGLVSFRLAWGMMGSTYARFATFFPTPVRLLTYLSGRWHGLGHNPLGALSVFGLLLLVGTQAGSGLWAQNDDTGYAGPLYALAGARTGELSTWLHHQVLDLLLPLVALHIGAIFFYLVVRRKNLVGPMITGNQENMTGQPARGGGPARLLLALTLAAIATWGASGSWYAPPPQPAAETPAW